MRLWPHFSFREALARRCACACRAGLLAFGCVVLLVPVNEEWLAEAQESKDAWPDPLCSSGTPELSVLRKAVWQRPAAHE